MIHRGQRITCSPLLCRHYTITSPGCQAFLALRSLCVLELSTPGDSVSGHTAVCDCDEARMRTTVAGDPGMEACVTGCL